MKQYFAFWLLFTVCSCKKILASTVDSTEKKYDIAYQQLFDLIKNNGLFKKAVWITENTFDESMLPESKYLEIINSIAVITNQGRHQSYIVGYYYSDSTNYIFNKLIFSTLCDTLLLQVDSIKFLYMPFGYNFDDPTGKKDWSNMFVTKLLSTQKGNCHSLAYLYKILADELGAKCWLALAPNHIYIRNYSRKTGWYNTELTSGTFPTDAWIATSTYVSTDAIRSGIYMDTLSNQQSIALCVLDLAKGYEFQTHNYYDGFILKCCELVLQYHPVNPMALLLKAETLKKVYLNQREEKKADSTATFAEMEKAYITLAKLHYREMPEKMYNAWLNSLTQQNKKYPYKKAIKLP